MLVFSIAYPLGGEARQAASHPWYQILLGLDTVAFLYNATLSNRLMTSIVWLTPSKRIRSKSSGGAKHGVSSSGVENIQTLEDLTTLSLSSNSGKHRLQAGQHFRAIFFIRLAAAKQFQPQMGQQTFTVSQPRR